jgi:hypothetical protein
VGVGTGDGVLGVADPPPHDVRFIQHKTAVVWRMRFMTETPAKEMFQVDKTVERAPLDLCLQVIGKNVTLECVNGC